METASNNPNLMITGKRCLVLVLRMIEDSTNYCLNNKMFTTRNDSVKDPIRMLTPEETIMSASTFIYISYGIILSIILAIGIPGNFMALVVLLHRSLQSAPVCILKVLTLHGIINMFYSIHSEVLPALKSHAETKLLVESFSTGWKLPSAIIPPRKLDDNRTVSWTEAENLFLPVSQSDLFSSGFIPASDSALNITTHPNTSLSLLFKGRNLDSEIEIFISGAIDRFFGGTFVFLGLLLTLCLALERSVAIFFPLKAARWLTIYKTRILLAGIITLCIFIHVPQLIIEIDSAHSDHSIELDSNTLLKPIRKEYDEFFVIIGLIVCLTTFVLNIMLLCKLLSFHKKFNTCRHIRHTERTEINITVAIVVLVFFQLPFHVFGTLIAFSPKDLISIDMFTKIAVVFRVLYISQSAFNFVIYCLLARNCRRVVLLMVRKVSSSVRLGHTINQDEQTNSSLRKSLTCTKELLKYKQNVGLDMLGKTKKVKTVLMTEYSGQSNYSEQSV